jgi:hypothetical protein
MHLTPDTTNLFGWMYYDGIIKVNRYGQKEMREHGVGEGEKEGRPGHSSNSAVTTVNTFNRSAY